MSMPRQKPGKSKQDYGTPKELLDAVRHRLQIDFFNIDLAASPENTVADVYFTEVDNSLVQDWHVHTAGGWGWLNPPFSNIGPWVRKAAEEALRGASVIMLVPSSVGSNWWSEFADGHCYVAHLNGRLTFVGESTPYPKDCSLLLYTPWGFKGQEVWSWRQNN